MVDIDHTGPEPTGDERPEQVSAEELKDQLEVEFQEISGGALIGAAGLEDALVVGAVAVEDLTQPAAYSNAGPAARVDRFSGEVVTSETLDVVATAGVGVSGFGIGPNRFDGTSAAAAHVAAIAALLREIKPDATREELSAAIQNSAVDLGASGRDPLSGFGRIDAVAAANVVRASLEPPLPALTAGSPTSPPNQDADRLEQLFEGLPTITLVGPTDQGLQDLLLGTATPDTDALRVRIATTSPATENAFAAVEGTFPFDAPMWVN